MAKVSVTEAARLAGISRQLLYKKYINPGVISVGKEDGTPFIDTVEIMRVFGPLQPLQAEGSQVDSQQIHGLTPEIDSDYSSLEAELKAARKALRDREDQLREAKVREERLWQQLQDVTGAIKRLEYKPEQPEQKPQPDPMLTERAQELENENRRLKEIESKLLAERKQMRSELLQEKTKTWWDKVRGR